MSEKQFDAIRRIPRKLDFRPKTGKRKAEDDAARAAVLHRRGLDAPEFEVKQERPLVQPETVHGSQYQDAAKVAIHPMVIDIERVAPAILRKRTLDAVRALAEMHNWPWEGHTLPAVGASGVLFAIKQGVQAISRNASRWPYSVLAPDEARREVRALIRLLEKGRGCEVRPHFDG